MNFVWADETEGRWRDAGGVVPSRLSYPRCIV